MRILALALLVPALACAEPKQTLPLKGQAAGAGDTKQEKPDKKVVQLGGTAHAVSSAGNK